MFPIKTTPFADCIDHGPGSGAELLIVEGESAAKAVVRVRDPRFQAVLAMQGKPLNAWKATAEAVANNALLQELIAVMGAGWGDSLSPGENRFERIVLLCDPDADGIHCNVLLLLFFYRWMRPLLDAGQLGAVRPPVYEITIPATQQVVYAYTQEHYRRIRAALAEQGVRDFRRVHYRGLASMSGRTLVTTCVAPTTRKFIGLSVTDAAAAVAQLQNAALPFDEDPTSGPRGR